MHAALGDHDTILVHDQEVRRVSDGRGTRTVGSLDVQLDLGRLREERNDLRVVVQQDCLCLFAATALQLESRLSLLAEVGEGVVASVPLHIARRSLLDAGVEVASARLRQPRRKDRLLDPVAERGTRLPGVYGVRVH